MPLTEFVAEAIFNAAVRQFDRLVGPARAYDVALRINALKNYNPSTFGFSSEQALFNAVWNVVKSAQSAVATARAVQDGAQLPIRPPRVPGIEWTQPEYSYRAVVQIWDAAGGRHSTAVTIRNDTSLSMQQVRELAIEMVTNSTPQLGGSKGLQRVQGLLPTGQADVQLLTVGRRG